MKKENEGRFWLNGLKSGKQWLDLSFSFRSIISFLVIMVFLVIGDSICIVADAQNLAITPVPTWTVNQWQDATGDERMKERAIENQQSGIIIKPMPHSKDFVPGAHHPLPPTNLKITVENGMAYLSWDNVKGAADYIIYDSQDGKKYKARKIPIDETKIFVGYVITLKQQPIHYFGIASHYYSERSEKTLLSVGPKDFDSK
jgi:hypothetical protein